MHPFSVGYNKIFLAMQLSFCGRNYAGRQNVRGLIARKISFSV